jgi:hypothetical protein
MTVLRQRVLLSNLVTGLDTRASVSTAGRSCHYQ